jgi:uncharacterized membrane protein (DUF4010 family)
MLVIVMLLGAAFYVVDRYSVRLYYEELSQRLNASLAMYVANARPLIRNGEVNRQALEALANRAMVINPTAEIYLVAPGGTILGHALPPEDVERTRPSPAAYPGISMSCWEVRGTKPSPHKLPAVTGNA